MDVSLKVREEEDMGCTKWYGRPHGNWNSKLGPWEIKAFLSGSPLQTVAAERHLAKGSGWTGTALAAPEHLGSCVRGARRWTWMTTASQAPARWGF